MSADVQFSYVKKSSSIIVEWPLIKPWIHEAKIELNTLCLRIKEILYGDV